MASERGCNPAPARRALTAALLIGAALLTAPAADAANIWGRLANPGFEGQRIKTTFFFAGPARDGARRYSCRPAAGDQRFQPIEPDGRFFPRDSNVGTYTLRPVPADLHLDWSEDHRDTVMTMMAGAGINVITMSYWGEDFLPCGDGWVSGAAPMQDSAETQDELFAAAARKNLLIAPLIESRASWTMREEFPTWSDGRVSPGLVSQIVTLVRRYLQDPARPEWARSWARVYDKSGAPRYAVGLIHAASNNLDGDEHEAFAAGFDRVAEAVAAATGGVQVGFLIDATPANGNLAQASFKPSPRWTAPALLNTRSLLGIQCFAPEIFVDESGDDDILAWKRGFLRGWISANIPVLVDVSPGYNGDIVFGGDAHRPYGLSAEWFDGMTAIVNDFARGGIIYNSWNGYTEAMAGTPTIERGTQLYDWLTSLNAHRELFVDRAASGPESGTAAEPFKSIVPANDLSSGGDTISIRTGNYPGAITFTNQLTIVARDGPVTIGAR
ncbi:MAG: hypothetical protein ABI868_25565 [Acidobacteriota bacterium]